MQQYLWIMIFLVGFSINARTPVFAEPSIADTVIQSGAQDVSDRAYVSKVQELIGFAARNIDLSLETISISRDQYDPVSRLINELIRAAKRGVRVRLFLNTFSTTSYDASAFLREDVLERLYRNQVRVHFVSPRYHLSDKLLIVDDSLVLEGGPAWTKTDFEESLASATLSHSLPLAVAKRKRLEMLPLWDIKSQREQRTEGRLSVPLYLLQEVRYFPGMVRSEDGDAMKIYLALLRTFYETQKLEFTVDFEGLSHQIPGDKFYERHAVTFEVMSAIERLEQQYNLLDIVNEEADRVTVHLLLPKSLNPVVGVPLLFFDENFAKEITPNGIYVYLVILYRMQVSGESPVWLGSAANVEQDFPIDRGSFREGVSDLRRSNLLEVFPFHLNQNNQSLSLEKPEYRYLINSVPTLSERLSTWDRLRDYYGEISFHKARDLAGLFGEPDDPKVIVTYIQLLQKFSIEDVRALTEHVTQLPAKSTPEMLDYLEALLRNETQRNFQLATY